AIRHLVQHRIPAGKAGTVCLLAVGYIYRGCPVAVLLSLAAYPDTYVRVALLGAAKPGGYQALLCFRNGSGVAGWEGRFFINKFVCNNAFFPGVASIALAPSCKSDQYQ